MIGRHYTAQDINNLAFQLSQAYDQFCDLAETLAAVVAPYSDATLSARITGLTQQDALDFISGVNVANALRLHSLRNTDGPTIAANPSQAATASQAAVALGKFSGA